MRQKNSRECVNNIEGEKRKIKSKKYKFEKMFWHVAAFQLVSAESSQNTPKISYCAIKLQEIENEKLEDYMKKLK